MKTQLHLYVKNESFGTRFAGGGLWFINIFRKLPIDIAVDGNKVRYKPQDAPYVIDLAPGQHMIEGRDPRALTKKADKALTGAIMGAAGLGAGGGSMIAGAVIGAILAVEVHLKLAFLLSAFQKDEKGASDERSIAQNKFLQLYERTGNSVYQEKARALQKPNSTGRKRKLWSF